jgi:hypothetical protein
VSAAAPVPDALLRHEARALGRFIVGGEVAGELVERYVDAHRHLFTEPQSLADLGLVAFAVAHPILLPCLDAAAALAGPDALLHRKALLMAAILEASPRHADDFLPRTRGLAGLLALLLRVGVASAAHVAVGLPALLILRRRS